MPTTQYMNLSLPTVTVTQGPEWASQLNTALTAVDAHDHSIGKGSKITPLGLNINADLTMGSNNLTNSRSVRFVNNTSAVGGATDLRSIYVLNNDLYYNNESGTAVRLTFSNSLYGPSIGAFTANRAIVTDSIGLLGASTTTDTQIGYLSNLSADVQDSLDSKVTDPMTTNGDIIYRAAGVPSRLAIGAADTVLKTDGSAPSWGKLVDANIDSAAAIAVSKLAALTASRVLVSDGSGVVSPSSVTNTTLSYLDATSSIQTQLNSKASTTDLSNHESDTTSIHGIADTAALVTLTDAQTLTSKTLTTPTLENPIVQGAISLEEQSSTPSTPSNGEKKLYAKDDGKVYTLNSAGQEKQVGAGAGGSGINYLADYYDGSTVSGITSSDAGLTYSVLNSSPLRATGNIRLSKDAADRSTQYWSIPLTDMDPADLIGLPRQVLKFKLRTSANYVASDIRARIYDVTAGAYINVESLADASGYLPASDGTTFVGSWFPTTANNVEYELRIYVATTNSNAYDVDVVDLSSSVDQVVPGAIVTEWQSFTPTGSWSSNTTYTGMWRRVGDTMEVQARVATSDAPTSANLTINLPSGYSIDTAKLAAGIFPQNLGAGKIHDNLTQEYEAVVNYNGATSVIVAAVAAGGTYGTDASTVSATVPITFGSGDSVAVHFKVPISGWSASAALSTTETMLMSAKFTASKSANQTVSSTSATKVTWSTTGLVDNLGWFDSTNNRYVVKRKGRFDVNCGLRLGSATAENYIIQIYVNGSIVRGTTWVNDVADPGFMISAPLDLNANDYIEIYIQSVSDASYTVNATAGTWFSVTEHPDFTVFSVYGQFQLLTATSSTKTPSASGQYQAHTGNSLTLTPGTWRLFGNITLDASGGSPAYSEALAGWYGANGADSSSAPATALSAVSGLTVLSSTKFYTYQNYSLSGGAISAPIVIVRCTSACTVYLDTYTAMTTAANARITVYANAERLQ